MEENAKKCNLKLLKNIKLRLENTLSSLDISEFDKMEVCFNYISKLESFNEVILKLNK